MTPASNHAHTISCTEQNCRLPVGRIVNGELVIQVKHHGEKHFATIPIVDLLRLIPPTTDTNLLTNQIETGTSRR